MNEEEALKKVIFCLEIGVTEVIELSVCSSA